MGVSGQSSPFQSQKMGFWAVFALVIVCQMDSGVFMLPANLAPYGLSYLGGLALTCLGGSALALVFAQLCTWYPKTGGPHVFVEQAFGRTLAFFTGWTYWVISWVSSAVIVVVSVSYLKPLMSSYLPPNAIALEILLMVIVTALNFFGVQAAGRVGLVFAVVRFFPLLIMPLFALFFFDPTHFSVAPGVANLTLPQTLNQVILLIMWGFVGLETATTSAGEIRNPTKTIPRAVIFGTLCVGVLYLISSLGIMGLIPGDQLMNSCEPYADAARILFGGNWHVLISVIASISCIVALNGWMLTSGQVALGLAQDGFLPSFFARKNRFNAPYWSLAISCIGMVLLLLFTANEVLAKRIFTIIGFSVVTFLFVYVVCCLAFFKLLLSKRGDTLFFVHSAVSGALALGFCLWVIVGTPLQVLLIASLFAVSGVPFCLHFLRARKRNEARIDDAGWVPATRIVFARSKQPTPREPAVVLVKGNSGTRQQEKEK